MIFSIYYDKCSFMTPRLRKKPIKCSMKVCVGGIFLFMRSAGCLRVAPRGRHLMMRLQASTTSEPATAVDGNADEPRARVRQHVNPLSSTYQVPISLSESWVCFPILPLQSPYVPALI
jgi:hypothetical protein